ncbi:hypothetical protein BX661DRAFT_198469 [Kickxella alabastrina]|uniref:uncharacterized protein n=1 Tax=Kickxella alabastrina TaxID=61397 RepID=UPI002220CEC4|nr:uncharacterized protein BX661DRAFT_198469 [Kickxella alabastrina]KAI7827908.1 hypothetical protein BX661DRAFT_198469 [Kickxella alabastrina]
MSSISTGAALSPSTTPNGQMANNAFFSMLGRSNSFKSDQSQHSQLHTSSPSVGISQDPNYWVNIHKARNIRESILKLKAFLDRVLQAAPSEQRTSDYHKVTAEIRSRERKLMKYINHYTLNYYDVVSDRQADEVPVKRTDKSLAPEPPTQIELGTISPPMSPATMVSPSVLQPLGVAPTGLGAKRQAHINIEVPPHFASGSLPPTPTTIDSPVSEHTPLQLQQREPALGSQAFINSYKMDTKYQNADRNVGSSDNSSTEFRKESRAPGGVGADGGRSKSYANDSLRPQIKKMASSPLLAPIQLKAPRKTSDPQSLYS